MNGEIQQTRENILPGSLPGGALQQNLQQNLHQTQQTNNVFVNQTLSQPPTVMASENFTTLLRAVPVKSENITKLLADGGNFDVWDADIREFLGMIPMVVEYLKEEALPNVEGWNTNMANGVNSVLHWTINHQLGMRLREQSLYPSVKMTYLPFPLFNKSRIGCMIHPLQHLTHTFHD